MRKSIVLSAIIALGVTTGALAQDANGQGASYRRLVVTNRDMAAERQQLYDHATSLVARAGLSNNYALSQQQLFSLFLVMSLQAQNSQHHSE